MTSNYNKTLIKYYKDNLKAERNYEIMKMIFETSNKYSLQKEKKIVNQNEFCKLINDKITILYQNMMEENILGRNQFKKLEDKFENLNKTMVENNKSMKTGIKSIDNKILQYNKRIIDQDIVQNKNIKLLENKLLKLTRNIHVLKNDLNVEEEEEEDDGPIDRDGTENIWKASCEGSLAGVKYWYTLDPASISRRNEVFPNYSPLHCASQKGHLEIVHFLLSKGVDVDVEDAEDCTPLMWASVCCHVSHVSVVRALLAEGAEINNKNRYNDTPLHFAVWGNNFSVVQILIEMGADQSLRNNYNRTPLEMARLMEHMESIVEYLTSH